MEQLSVPAAAELEQHIVELPGVSAARVREVADGRVSEIHVVADTSKSAKQLVRDIQTLALAKLGLDLDYRTVSIVQIDDLQANGAALSRDARVVFEELSWTTSTNLASCSVRLSLGMRDAHGSASGPPTPRSRLRLTADATSRALVALVPSISVQVLDEAVVQGGSERVVVVLLDCGSGRRRDICSGSCVVRFDETDAVARAVLDAVNRRLGQHERC